MTRTILVAAMLVAIAPLAQAGEDDIHLKTGAGLDQVQANCRACHSLDYIEMNSPFLDRQAWEKEVDKMINALGAPITPEDRQPIIDYLATNYGAVPEQSAEKSVSQPAGR